MSSRHRALVVEDNVEQARDLTQLLEEECACECVHVTNREDALREVAGAPFCIFLLDLQILPDAGAIRPSVEHGREVLRATRQRYPERNGTKDVTPIVIVSGFAREADEAVAAMKDGASEVVHKTSKRTEQIDKIYKALEVAGRTSHERCLQIASTTASHVLHGKCLLTIPARRAGRRFVVTLGGKEARLRPSTLEVLLHLVKGRLQGADIHRDDLQAPGSGGLRLVSELRQDMEPAHPPTPIVGNDSHGHYCLHESVSVGEVDTKMLQTIDERRIPKLAREIANLLEQKPGSDGKR